MTFDLDGTVLRLNLRITRETITDIGELVRRRERSGFVWLAMVPGLVALVFLIGEFLRMW